MPPNLPPAPSHYFHALIRTHHITSRRKLSRLKSATKHLNVSALVRSGGAPGVMYVFGTDRVAVQKWVDVVHALRYKDFRLVKSVSEIEGGKGGMEKHQGEMEEVENVREMAVRMEGMGLLGWWRVGMGFDAEDGT